jgi:hypothetical protein
MAQVALTLVVDLLRRRVVKMTDVQVQKPDSEGRISQSLTAQLAFQRRWQRLSAFAYVSSTVGVLFCSTGATLAAAQNMSELAAYLAAAATILIGLEKSMLFREKWKFHLAVATRLSVLSIEMEAGVIAREKVIEQYSAILGMYSEGLPIANRENA